MANWIRLKIYWWSLTVLYSLTCCLYNYIYVKINKTYTFLQLLTFDPAERLGAGKDGINEIKQHPYFKQIDWQEIYDSWLIPDWCDSQLYTKWRVFALSDIVHKSCDVRTEYCHFLPIEVKKGLLICYMGCNLPTCSVCRFTRTEQKQRAANYMGCNLPTEFCLQICSWIGIFSKTSEVLAYPYGEIRACVFFSRVIGAKPKDIILAFVLLYLTLWASR
jgi:hypothetical protein